MIEQLKTIQTGLAIAIDAEGFVDKPVRRALLDAVKAAAQLEAMVGEQETLTRIVTTENQEPMFWVRLCSDGMYEGPIHNAQIERVRAQSGAWSPLFLGAAPAAQQCEAGDVASAAAQGFRNGVASVAQQPQKLEDVEQYRMQMAGISTAAMGYWKEGDSIHPDYDTPALRDVAKLYAKYDALYKAQQPQAKPHKPLFADLIAQHPGLREELLEMGKQPQAEPFGYVSQHTNGTWEFSPTPAGVYPDTAKSITAVYTKQPQAEHDLDVVWKLHGPDN